MDEVVINEAAMHKNSRIANENLEVAKICFRVKRMIKIFHGKEFKKIDEKELAEKYFKFWKGEREEPVDSLVVLREKLKKEFLNVCDVEAKKAHESCFKIRHYISNIGLDTPPV